MTDRATDSITPQRPTLLIADDEPLTRSVLWSQFHREFNCVGAARDAPEAVALARSLRPDVVVLDVEMPGGGARHAVPAIRRGSPDTAIVLISADELHTEVVSLLGAGAMTYMRKGIGRHEMARRILASIAAHRTPVAMAA